jgi:hypothetical protein
MSLDYFPLVLAHYNEHLESKVNPTIQDGWSLRPAENGRYLSSEVSFEINSGQIAFNGEPPRTEDEIPQGVAEEIFRLNDIYAEDNSWVHSIKHDFSGPK